jgi:hypothetical protein
MRIGIVCNLRLRDVAVCVFEGMVAGLSGKGCGSFTFVQVISAVEVNRISVQESYCRVRYSALLQTLLAHLSTEEFIACFVR